MELHGFRYMLEVSSDELVALKMTGKSFMDMFDDKVRELHSKYLDKLPKCKQYVIDNQEMMEEYWAREIAWAISKIQKENGVVNWRGIRDLTNLSKANYLRTISYFENKNIEICSRIREGQGRYCVQIQKWI